MFFAGLGFSFMFIPCVVIVGEYFDDKRRAYAIPLSVSGVGVFCLFIPPLLRCLIGHFGWRGCLLLSAGIALQGAIFAALFTPLPKPAKDLSADSSAEAKTGILCETGPLKNLIFWLFFMNNVLWNAGSLILIVLIVDYAKESGISKDSGALLLASVGICGTVGRLIAAVTARCVNRLHLYTAATLATGIFIALIPARAVLTVFILCCCAYGVCFGIQVGLLGVLTADLFGVEILNAAYGYLVVSNGVGALLGPPIAGKVFF